MGDWVVTLVPVRPNGRYRFVRVVGDFDWDDSLVEAERVSPGWEGVGAGPFVEGAEIDFYEEGK